ncbi:F-actin-capping protein subunit beta [Malassezia cuniculi]|uniref:F-actin-capping protein subunit beta n=1 Tax=Malassezia cuniculi TaxID=948313 RepID=A0AAF0F1J3_9BASI|nr:F-actin-capping protein subunit beta [Malassezia cuniculi]
MADPVSLSLDLLRRLPPADVATHVRQLSDALPEHADELASSVDQPLRVGIDGSAEGAGREFLCCDYNRDGGSWRSWISNAYYPALSDAQGTEGAVYPSSRLRELELRANDAFDTYRQLYYDAGLTSTYMWDLDGETVSMPEGDVPANFAGVVLFKKDVDHGTWDSLHVFEVATAGKTAHYKLNSTVMLTLSSRAQGSVDLSGSLSRESDERLRVSDFAGHIANLGRLVEEAEGRIRNQLQEVYFGKTRDVVGLVRSHASLAATREAARSVRRHM